MWQFNFRVAIAARLQRLFGIAHARLPFPNTLLAELCAVSQTLQMSFPHYSGTITGARHQFYSGGRQNVAGVGFVDENFWD